MFKNKTCDFCKEDLGFIYMMTRTGYKCLPCHHLIREQSIKALEKLPDVPELPPIDNKYLNGIIAKDEESAKRLCDLYYEATPGFFELEN